MEIKSFTMTFTVKDNAEFVRDIDSYSGKITNMMKDEGYIPVVDLRPQIDNINYNDDNFDIDLTSFGMYVGEKAWDMEATSINKTTQKYLLPNK